MFRSHPVNRTHLRKCSGHLTIVHSKHLSARLIEEDIPKFPATAADGDGVHTTTNHALSMQHGESQIQHHGDEGEGIDSGSPNKKGKDTLSVSIKESNWVMELQR